MGITEWCLVTTYTEGDLVKFKGKTYRAATESLIGTDPETKSIRVLVDVKIDTRRGFFSSTTTITREFERLKPWEVMPENITGRL